MRSPLSRRLLLPGLFAVMALAAAHTVIWRIAVQRVASETLAWALAQQAAGWRIQLGPMQQEGWPFAAHVRVQPFAVAAPLPTALSYAAETAVIGVALVQPHRLTVEASGTQHIQLGRTPDFAVTADSTVLTLPIDAAVPTQQADLDIAGASLAAPGDVGPVRIARLHLHLDFPLPTLAATLEAGPIDLQPTALAAALGPRIDHVALDARAPVPSPGMTPSAWREAGGTLELRHAALAWGSLTIDGSAALSLDARLQPEGRGQARLTGTGAALDAFAAVGLVQPRIAGAAKAVLTLLSRPQDSGPPVVDVPLSLQDRTVQIGHIPITRLPEIVW